MARRKFALSFFCILISIAGMAPLLAAAQNYDIKQMTPEIQQALNNRKARYAKLQSLKAQGAVGENRDGFVSALAASSGTSALVSSENTDRETIYRAIADQNGLGAGGLSQIKSVFAEVQREKARPGDSVQLPNGTWAKK